MNSKTTSETPEVPAKPSKSDFTLSCYEWVEALIPALVIIMVLFTFLFRVITVNGPSMMPNLKNGYKVLVSCTDRKLTRGDIVVVDGRGTSLHEIIIKRVIATEGQTVNIDFNTGVVSVNGVPLDESAYIENGINMTFLSRRPFLRGMFLCWAITAGFPTTAVLATSV